MTQLQITDREIETKGTCYVVCTTYDPTDFDAQMAAVLETARRRGARLLCFACQDAAQRFDADAYILGEQRFQFDTAFDILQKPLSAADAAQRPLFRTKRLRQDNAPLYIALYNESFFDVPNARTVDAKETGSVLSDEGRDAGFFMLGGEPFGVFQLDYREDVPEIAALAIRPPYRKQGYGAQALHTLEARLAQEGYPAAQLLTAEKNEAAYALYRANGYEKKRELSRWFCAELWSK